MHSFIGKYLLTSRNGHEIVDLLNPNATYDLLADNLPKIYRATGGLLQKSLIVCGGNYGVHTKNLQNSRDCVVIGQPEMKIKMITKRSFAASVVLDQNILWIVGGYNGRYNLRSTEFIRLGQPSVKGPDMPFTINRHSMIQYDEKSIYIIGGNKNSSISNKTWIIDPTNGFRIKKGPSLNEGRQSHACAKMSINGRTVLVVAGGTTTTFANRRSVEILDPLGNNIWTPGLCLKSISAEFF